MPQRRAHLCQRGRVALRLGRTEGRGTPRVGRSKARPHLGGVAVPLRGPQPELIALGRPQPRRLRGRVRVLG